MRKQIGTNLTLNRPVSTFLHRQANFKAYKLLSRKDRQTPSHHEIT